MALRTPNLQILQSEMSNSFHCAGWKSRLPHNSSFPGRGSKYGISIALSLYRWEFRLTLNVIARILREVVNRVKLGHHHTQRRSRGEVKSHVVMIERGRRSVLYLCCVVSDRDSDRDRYRDRDRDIIIDRDRDRDRGRHRDRDRGR